MKKERQISRDDGAGHISDHEARVAEINHFNLLSNVFMSVALDDKLACQHVLRVLTGIQDLTVIAVRSQYRISKLVSHDAILDILAEDSNGKLFSMEIQRSDAVDHARRVRFYGAMADNEYLVKGKAYSDLPDLQVVYISETDLWKNSRTAYQVEKTLKDTGIRYDDGQQILFVNAAVDDGSEIAKLMKYFKTADPDDMSQGALSKRVRFLKCEEGGLQIMCAICEKIFEEGREEERGVWQVKLDAAIAGKDAAIADKDAAIADKDAVIADQEAMIAELLARLGEAV